MPFAGDGPQNLDRRGADGRLDAAGHGGRHRTVLSRAHLHVREIQGEPQLQDRSVMGIYGCLSVCVSKKYKESPNCRTGQLWGSMAV